MTAHVIDLEEFKAAKMPSLAYGTLEIKGDRIRLVADVKLTRASALTLAANLIELSNQLKPAE